MADITINLRADPTQFESGVKAAEGAIEEWENSSGDSADVVAKKLEQVIRTLVKLGTESGKTGDEMRADLRKFGLSAEQAEDAVEAVWKEMRDGKSATRGIEDAADAFDDVEKKADDAADATSKVGDASKKTGADVSDLGDIARDVLEGDFGSAAEGAISALGALGLFAGPAGALAGLIAAGGAGIIGTFIDQWNQAAQASEKRIGDMYDDMLASGESFLSQNLINEKIAELTGDTEQLTQARKDAAAAGVDETDVIRATAGDMAALSEVLSAANGKREELQGSIDRQVEAHGRASESTIRERDAVIDLADRMLGLAHDQDTAASKASIAQQAMDDSAAANHRTADSLDRVAASASSVPDGKTIAIGADTSAFDAEVERIRRQRISTRVDVDYVINERRGRFTVE